MDRERFWDEVRRIPEMDLTDDSFKEYAFGMVLTYDEHGNPDVKVVKKRRKDSAEYCSQKDH